MTLVPNFFLEIQPVYVFFLGFYNSLSFFKALNMFEQIKSSLKLVVGIVVYEEGHFEEREMRSPLC